jgi:hypothetical protein
MKIFHCDHCEQLLFFENTVCINCGHKLAYLTDLAVIGSLDEAEDGLWKSPLKRASDKRWRLCQNYTDHNVCNWAVPADDPNPLCRACRLTTVIPDLDKPHHKEWWYKLEVAKRRLEYTLLALGLPVFSKEEDPKGGVSFEFKADPEDPKEPRVLTGHANGVITINVIEADDALREKMRVDMHEPYRTLLGHFRHEVGHYYWDRLVRDDEKRLAAFRELFGDDREDYAAALKNHYDNGPAADWQTRCVTAYASVHAWEDWAETWAHYLHMTDTLETAASCGVSLRPRQRDLPKMKEVPNPVDSTPSAFDDLIDSWFPLTYMLNSLNRGLGQPDAYPFVLSGPAIEKLRFVHDTVADAGGVVQSGDDADAEGGFFARAVRRLFRGLPAGVPE